MTPQSSVHSFMPVTTSSRNKCDSRSTSRASSSLSPRSLVPSQVAGVLTHSNYKKAKSSCDQVAAKSSSQGLSLIPSQAIRFSRKNVAVRSSLSDFCLDDSSIEEEGGEVKQQTGGINKRQRRRVQRRLRKGKSVEAAAEPEKMVETVEPIPSPLPSNTNSSTLSKQKIKSNKKQARRSHFGGQKVGNLPDIHWGAIPMDHLRLHPNFEPLPHPSTIDFLETMEDVRNFRQGSWQWDVLHNGRCTTSQAAAALGFLEPKAGSELNIPASLRRGGFPTYCRLMSTEKNALRTLDDMRAALLAGELVPRSDGQYHDQPTHALWERVEASFNGTPYPFAAKYRISVSDRVLELRKRNAKDSVQDLSPGRIRMHWGNTQEATAVLTALNYFYKKDSGVVVKEVGMCGAGIIESNSTAGLLIGASPDAVLYHSDGTIEALEVKNHCPFVPASRMKSEAKKKGGRKGSGKALGTRAMPLRPNVPFAYIPQLMMEMLSLGPGCRSAVMVRQTANMGAVIVRLHRDDEWIEEMMYWLDRFNQDFVRVGTPPPENFFFEDGELGTRYKSFLQRTKELSNSVQLVDFIMNGAIQRVRGSWGGPTPLFLD